MNLRPDFVIIESNFLLWVSPRYVEQLTVLCLEFFWILVGDDSMLWAHAGGAPDALIGTFLGQVVFVYNSINVESRQIFLLFNNSL